MFDRNTLKIKRTDNKQEFFTCASSKCPSGRETDVCYSEQHAYDIGWRFTDHELFSPPKEITEYDGYERPFNKVLNPRGIITPDMKKITHKFPGETVAVCPLCASKYKWTEPTKQERLFNRYERTMLG